VREDELAKYCEAMLYDYEPDWHPPGVVELDRPDVLAWKRPGRPVGYSRVAYAKWSEEEADARVDEVLAFFGKTPFLWHVGPSSSPADLERRLVARGLIAGERPRLMTAALPLAGTWRSADVRIVEVADRTMARLGLSLAHHVGGAPVEGAELERMLDERMAYLALPRRRTHYLVAFVGDTLVANAGYRWSSDGRCLYLIGAETVEAYRGRGIYQSLITYRARVARERGCEMLSILANRHTSAPILTRHGFADHGDLPWFTRMPPPAS
jgi:GNAT superfamily N-acetyltransferase